MNVSNRTKSIFLDWKLLIVWVCFLFLGFGLRLWVASLGHNWDVASYDLVSGFVQNGESMYANTHRYNYGMFWACILSALKSLQNWLFVENDIQDFHLLVVAFLSLADMALAYLIGQNWGWKKALFFWLNPVSIAITGFHSQMENIAILWGFLGYFYLIRKPMKVELAAVLFGFSFIQKHLFIFLPIGLMFANFWESYWQRFKFLAISYGVFAIHFAGFLAAPESLEGIFKYVIAYRSDLGASLSGRITQSFLHAQELTKVFIVALLSICFLFRRSQQNLIFVYLAAMVFTTPSLADQYLAIPMLAICVYARNIWGYFYIFSATCYLCLRSPNNMGNLPTNAAFYSHYLESPFSKELFSVYAAQVFLFLWLLTLYYQERLHTKQPAPYPL